MEKLFDKMGLYDIWIVLFPGIVFQIGAQSLYDFMMSLRKFLSAVPGISGKVGLLLTIDITAPTNIYEFLFFLVFSYLYGLILHELSSILKHSIIYRKRDPRALLLNDTTGTLTNQELHRLMPLFKALNNDMEFSQSDPEKLREESNFLFQRMNKKLQGIKKSGDYAKLNIIYNMCGTLCVTLALLSFIVIAFGIEFLLRSELSSFFYSLIVLCMMFVLLLIMFFKSRRYLKYWVRNIVFAYEELCWNDKADR